MTPMTRTVAAVHTVWLKLVGALVGGVLMTVVAGAAVPIYAVAATSSAAVGVTQTSPGLSLAADPQNTKCKPHRGEGVNPHCPPPVVPEAPLAILLPLSAAAVLGATYFVTRRRWQAIPA
jgi:hypothetical protein